MNLSFRPAVLEDFEEFYSAFFPSDIYDTELRAVVEREWNVLLRNSTTLTMIVEAQEYSAGKRMVACAQGVFVTEHFAQLARCGRLPWIIVHVTRPLSDGSWPLLNPAGVRAANSGDGLIGLITRWRHNWATVAPEDVMNVHDYLHRSFATFTRGYKFKEILIEANGGPATQAALRAGFRLLNDYADYYNGLDSPPPPDKRQCLLHLTREQALASEGCLASYAFAYTPPHFFFKEKEQELLRQAVAGAEDEEIAALLDRSIWTVQKRWRTIYERVEQKLPDLLPEATDEKTKSGKRGAEKRRVLIRYLNEHPEELRPVEPPTGRHSPKRGKRPC